MQPPQQQTNGAAYEPKPGSIPFRALAHLEGLPRGAEVSTAKLALIVGAEPSSFSAIMETARAAGAVFARQKGGHPKSPRFWSLIDHAGAEGATRPGRAVQIEVGQTVNVAASDAAAAIKSLLRPETKLPQRETKPAEAETKRVEPETKPTARETLRIALWSDGRLHIQRPGGHAVVFDREETRQIVAYLDAIALDLVRGEAA